MKFRRHRSAWRTAFGAATIGACAAMASVASAGPVNKAWIAAEATWYVHIDSEAAVNSTLGKFVIANRGRLGIAGIDGIRALGVDPFKDIKSVTIYDTDGDPEHAVAIASMTSAIERLVDLIKSDPGTRTITVDGHDLIAFDDKGKTQYWHVRPGDAPDMRVVLLSDDWKIVTDALKVVNGDASSLARSPTTSPIAGDAGSGSIVFIRAAELPQRVKDNPDPNASALLGQVNGVQIDLGERDGEVYADAQLFTTSAEDTTSMAQIAQGLVALGRLISKDHPDLAPVNNVLAATKIEPRDRQLQVSFRYESRKVIEAVESMLAARDKEAARKAKAGNDKQEAKP